MTAEDVRQIREKLGLTREQLAMRLGIAEIGVRLFEEGSTVAIMSKEVKFKLEQLRDGN